jgi:Domain of unknown function (DUF222)
LRATAAGANIEAALVRAATIGVSVGQLEALARRATDVADPDGANADTECDFDRRGLHLCRGVAGSVLDQFELDAEAGELLTKAIDSVLSEERARGNPVVPNPVDSREYSHSSELLDVGTRTQHSPPPSVSPCTPVTPAAGSLAVAVGGDSTPNHLVHVTDGGDTSSTNGAGHCTTHHHDVHEGWTITGRPDHTLWFHPPT